uniref:Hypotheticial protein n=1 Tax=Schistosoma japonicum TaxID=6182 RepID=C1L3Q8_SCHJA|nr:hypotheticial protein [Schistosoma japonicum]
MNEKDCSSFCRCIYQSGTIVCKENGVVVNDKKPPSSNQRPLELRLNIITDIYIHCMLLACILIIIFVFSQPFTEHLLIRLIFGESLNYCNYTYVPSVNNYRRPYKSYT